MKISCVILASGSSQRFGEKDKLLAEFNGKALVEQVFSNLPKNEFSQVVCVTRNNEVAKIAKNYEIDAICHNMPEKKDTVKIGLDFLLENDNPDGILFAVADQPLLTAESIKNICDEFKNHPKNIIRLASRIADDELQPGNPVIFPKELFNELYNLKDKENGRKVIEENLEKVLLIAAAKIYELEDVDTPEKLIQLQHLFSV